MLNFRLHSLLLIFFLTTSVLVISCDPDDDPVTPTETCSDNVKNQDETGIDCGGICDACQTCDDGVKNGNETGIDCGGSCDACPTCTDGIQNGDETGIDCGGSCNPCVALFSEHITADIDDIAFAANLVVGFDNGSTIDFQSDQSQERQMFFTVPNNVTQGSYDLVNTTNFSAKYAKILEGDHITQSGTLVVTDNNTTKKELSGTFEFTTVVFDFGNPIDTVDVTSGSFSVEY